MNVWMNHWRNFVHNLGILRNLFKLKKKIWTSQKIEDKTNSNFDLAIIESHPFSN